VSELQPFQKVDKQALARRFGAAAHHYDRHAAFQREVGHALLDWLPVHSERLLDLGCGTGYFLPALDTRCSELLGLDLAPGMLAQARLRTHGAALLCGDAEALPLGNGSVDTIFSSLALQWCEHPEQAFAELYRVLRVGGVLVCSTLLAGSLCELKQAWQSVDEGAHVNRFLEQARWEQAICSAGLTIAHLEVRPWRLEYGEVSELLRDLKGIGASQVNDGRTAGLGGRARLQALGLAYERMRCDGKLPATYQVGLAVLRRTA
jgi:malonyl-CoA O-methyltransferase